MKFTANRHDLLEAVTNAASITPKQSTLPILENVKLYAFLNELTVTGANLETFTIARCKITTSSSISTSITAPVAILIKALKNIDANSIEFTAIPETGKITITTATGIYNITGESIENFPRTPDVPALFRLDLDADICTALARSLPFVSTDEMRPSMLGINFNNADDILSLCTTDGHRLYTATFANRHIIPFNFTVTPEAIRIALKHAPESISYTLPEDDESQWLQIHCSDLDIITKAIPEKYPDYPNVFPSEEIRQLSVTLNRGAVQTALKRILPFANQKTKQCRLSIANDIATLAAADMDLGAEAAEAITCSISALAAADIEIGFNILYMQSILSTMPEEYITCHFYGTTRAIIIKQQPEEQYLLMPVRLIDFETKAEAAPAPATEVTEEVEEEQEAETY